MPPTLGANTYGGICGYFVLYDPIVNILLYPQVSVDDGWTPSVQQAIISDDPLLQQIGILHGFIDQAERAGKTEEITILRQNLMDLEDALDKREAAEKVAPIQ